MPKNLAKILIGVALAFGLLALAVPDGAFRDGFGAMQLALVLCAGYVYWNASKK